MGVWSAMSNAVSGIAAQSYALENISGNISNSQTTAYKRTDTSFSDLVSSSSSNVSTTTSGAVMATSVSATSLAGDTTSSDIDTYMAIDDDTSFFEVTDGVDGDMTLYTRRGDFSVDSDGYLVNGTGYYLQGYAIDDNGTASNQLETINIDADTMAASATASITYTANLPTTPTTTYSTNNSSVDNADLYTDADSDYSVITGSEEDTFLSQSISGGSVTVYDSEGTASTLQTRWAKIGDNEWGLYYQSNSSAGDTDTAWTMVSSGASDGTVAGSFTFDSSGSLVQDASPLTISDLTINGSSLGSVSLDMSLTQYADTDGTVTTTNLTQDGFAAGTYSSMAIGDDGVVSYTYSNGQTKDIWQIPTVSFANASGLKSLDGGAYSATEESGQPSASDSTLTSSALESSNVDISEEFTKLIVTQQAYSANSKVITTANEMLDDILNLIR